MSIPVLETYDRFRLDMSTAYASISEADRAWLKQSMAMTQQLYSFLPWQNEQGRVQAENAGFASVQRSWPLPWALLFFPPEYAAPVRLLAALMPAILARVPDIIPVCTGNNCQPALLAALELAGLETVYGLDGAVLEEFAAQFALPASHPGGRGKGVSLIMAGAMVPVSIRTVSERCWQEPFPLQCACSAHPQLDQAQILRSHPDLCLSTLSATTEPSDLFFDALYGLNRAESANVDAPLVLGTGLEGCWIFPQLEPDFFRIQQVAFEYF